MTAPPVVVRVSNMVCAGCERGVRATLAEALPGAAVVAVDLAARTVGLNSADVTAAVAALRADGWEAEAGA